MKYLLTRYLISVLFLLAPGAVFAHGAGEAGGLLHGVIHPFTGADHLLAMIAVGLWAAQLGGRAVWLVPATFVCAMTAGGLLGMAAMPLVEAGVLASLLVLGALIFGAIRLPLIICLPLIGFFALFHGYAHGAEMPADASFLNYAAGFIFSTAVLHLTGIVMANMLAKTGMRLAGIALFGVSLWLVA